MEQLELPFSEEKAPWYRVALYQDDRLLGATSRPESAVGANLVRRSLVELLQRSPTSWAVWEEDPRPTGWYGLERKNGRTVTYILSVEKVQEHD